MTTSVTSASSARPEEARSGTGRRTGGADGSPSAPVRRVRKGTDVRTRVEIAVLAGPATIMFVGFVILPVVLAAYYGFYRWQGYGTPPTSSACRTTR